MMERWWAWQFALVALATVYLSPSLGQNAEFQSDTLINNVVADPRTGRLYIGAVNSLYQLNPDLGVESRTETGPKRDNRQCTPPVTDACDNAVDTDNHNKLLLVQGAKDVLVACGSVYRGICSLRNLSNVEQLLYFSDTKGEKSYVASAEESVSVVGVIVSSPRPSQVGKGYGNHDSTKLISTRILQDYGDWVVFDSIIEASAVQANPFLLRYLHDFRFAFKDGGFVYFLFSRTLGVQDTKNYTFISRMCEDDQGYYSYTELQDVQPRPSFAFYSVSENMYSDHLSCTSVINKKGERVETVLVLLFAGMYPLRSINKRLVEIIGACYSNNGIINEKPNNMALRYKCGAEFLPSPLASKAEYALTAQHPLICKGHMTAVAVAVEKGHAVAFLGTATGEVLKVHLSAQPEVYGRAPGDVTGDKPVLCVQIIKVPVQACHLKTDCQSCVAMKDPYCGWCVLEGKCTRKQECRRSSEDNTWLWSPNQQCVEIESFNPPNLSCKKTQQVWRELVNEHALSISLCGVDSPPSESPVLGLITCALPDPAEIPPTPDRQGRSTHGCTKVFLINGLSVPRVAEFAPASRSFKMTKTERFRADVPSCIACVTSEWGCQWNARDHSCSDRDDGVDGDHVPDSCPQFESPEPLLIPVGFEIPISFQGRNLEIYTVRAVRPEVNVSFHIKEKDTERKIDSTLTVVLYNCSVGREDCSLCKHADSTYQCVWCSATRTCVYRELCPSPQPAQCPDPEITDIVPRFGPLNGRISVTIKGSNMGIKKEDIKKITVAGVDLTDVIIFSVQDPKPVAVHPAKGPAAGGTRITITGTDLDTATKDDIAVTVGGFPCEVLSFGKEITCKTGKYRGQKVPSDLLPVQVKYGKNTTKDVTAVKFGHGEWKVGSVYYARKDDIPLAIIIPAVIVPMLLFIAVSVYCYRRKSQQAEREYEKVKHQLENLEESVRDRCKKEFTDLMIEMEDHTSDLSEARIPFLDYKTYTDRNFFLPSKDGANDAMITRKLQIPEARRAIVAQALNQFSNLLNSKTFLINFIRTLESRPDFNARARGYFASLLTVALHGKLEYYTDIMRTLLLEMMDEHVQSKNPKLMLRRSETVVERMLCNWMSICLYQFLRDTAGEPLYKLYKALKHQVEKGPVDAKMKKAKYTLNDTGLLGDDVEYSVLTLQVLVHGEGPDVTPVKVLNCDTISQVKEKIIDQVYRNLPYSQRPKVECVALEWRPGSTGQILSDLDLTSQKEGRWKRLNTLAHYNVRDNATLVLSRVLHTQSFHQHQDSYEEKNSLLEDDNTFHLVRPADEIDEVKSKRGSMKDKAMTKAITEIYLTRLLSVKGTLQQFVDDFFRSVLCSGSVVPPAVKYFFDFLDEQALRHDNVDEETLHIWKTNSLPSRFWVNILRNPHFIFDVHVTEVVDASLHVISQTFMDACTKSEHKLSRESPSNKLLYAKEISTYKKMVDDYYKGIRQMVPVSDQDMNTHLAEVSRQHTDKLNTQVALHQLYQYASKYYDVVRNSLDEDPAAQNKQLTLRLQGIAAALENKVTDL
uniref:Plexin b2a, tandem duplicate 1 n=1 Tax=Sparus aurata TaxID=8175 RepID=A0A671Y2M7_SPAAU